MPERQNNAAMTNESAGPFRGRAGFVKYVSGVFQMVYRKPRIRAVVETVIIVVLAVCLARSGPVLRFYAVHAPVWNAKGSLMPKTESAAMIVAGARAQIGDLYDSGYVPISYPGGDVPSDRGACSDVVVRALRHAGIDLQRLIHEDLLHDPDGYLLLSPASAPDPNIDHRRCHNQIRFFTRHCIVLTFEVSAATREQWQPGDFVYWRQPGGRHHVGVLSDRTNAKALPLVIHSGSVCLEQDCLTDWEIVGHFRYPP